MREVRVYLGDDDTYDLASNCTVKVLDADDEVWFEIDIDALISRCGIDEFLSAVEGGE